MSPALIAEIAEAFGAKLGSLGRVFETLTGISGRLGNAVEGIGQQFESTFAVIRQFNSAASKIGSTIGEAVTNFNALTAAAGVASHGVDALVGVIRSQVARFVEVFDPGAVHLFEIAVRDLNATIGRVMQPALLVATHLVKKLSDSFAAFDIPGRRVVESFGKIVDAFTPIADEIVRYANEYFKMFDEALKNSGDSIEKFAEILVSLTRIGVDLSLVALSGTLLILGTALEILNPLLEAFAEILKFVAQTLTDFIRDWGGYGKTEAKPKKGTGMATAHAQFTSAQSYAQSAYASAYSLGEGMKNDPAVKTESHLSEIKKWLVEGKWVEMIPGYEKVRNAISGVKEATVGAYDRGESDTAGGIPNVNLGDFLLNPFYAAGVIRQGAREIF